jgi:uncharacterized membrane protein
MMPIALLFHILAAVIWVGGMFFAYVTLRPATAELDPAIRLPLFRRVLANFFPWVWAAIAALLISAYGVLVPDMGGFAGLPLFVNAMQVIGIVMILVFLHLFFAPWKRFRRAVDAGDLAAAAPQLVQIRYIVLFNLILGLIAIAIGGTGPNW